MDDAILFTSIAEILFTTLICRICIEKIQDLEYEVEFIFNEHELRNEKISFVAKLVGQNSACVEFDVESQRLSRYYSIDEFKKIADDMSRTYSGKLKTYKLLDWVPYER